MCYYLPTFWILGGKLSPDPSVTEAPETRYSELVLVRILLHLTRGLPCSEYVVTETGGVITLDSLNDVLANRLDTGLPKSTDSRGKKSPDSRGKLPGE